MPPLIALWEKEIGRQVTFWGIRRMKTKWGSCNREAARIWFNLELAKKDPACLEYVIVHEMAHLLERGHGERFTKLMDSLLPTGGTGATPSTARPLLRRPGNGDFVRPLASPPFQPVTALPCLIVLCHWI